MRRSAGRLEVEDAGTWAAARALIPLDGCVIRWLSPLACEVDETFPPLRAVLARGGLPPLVRYARRPTPSPWAPVSPNLERPALELLHRAQRHAVDGRVHDRHAWDPEADRELLRAVLGAGLLAPDPEHSGWFRLHPDLPPPPERPFDAADALLPEPDDLPPPAPGPLRLLHDAASLAAAILAVAPTRTLAGGLARADDKRLAAHLGAPPGVEASPRWGLAARALDALGVVSTDPITREVHLDLGLEALLEGDAADAIDRLLRRLVEPDVHLLLALLRTTFAQAGAEAVDEVVLRELVREQRRDVVFSPWHRGGGPVYPVDPERAFDDAGFDAVEAPLLAGLLARLERLGVVRRAPGVVAATADGRAWARVPGPPAPPVWVTGDLELLVPPDAVTPWERFQLERLGECLARDVVDRYRLSRKNLARWLETHDLDEALTWLRRRAPGLPRAVEDALDAWARGARRLVWHVGA